MSEKPVEAFRKKPDNSIAVSWRLLVVSAPGVDDQLSHIVHLCDDHNNVLRQRHPTVHRNRS